LKTKENPNVQSNKESRPVNEPHEPNDAFASKRDVMKQVGDKNAAVDVSEDAFIRNEKNMNKPKWVLGPVKAPSNVRSVLRIDYQPDLCKDYFETGYCGYGDNCKFLHDRGDYKSGWQLEKEFEKEEEQRQRRAMGQEVDAEENYEIDSEEFPWACFICRGDFKEPVVTRCNHYFCQECALKHYQTDKKCAACGHQTDGFFGRADKLMRVLDQRAKAGKKKPAELMAEAGQAGAEVGAVVNAHSESAGRPAAKKPAGPASAEKGARRSGWAIP